MNVGGYHVYIGRCSVHRRNTTSTLGGYSVHWGYHDAFGGAT